MEPFGKGGDRPKGLGHRLMEFAMITGRLARASQSRCVFAREADASNV